ncbi:MAG: ABC transporter substrate-binding protein [Thalassobaculales bacterium]
MLALLALLLGLPAAAAPPVEPPALAPLVAAGALPPVAERLPQRPAVARLSAGQQPGRHGGSITTLMARASDTRLMTVYGYARLVAYDPAYGLFPDLLERFEVEDERVFTFHLRPGHRWSDGHPFTAEDFRFWWEDFANNPALSPAGPPDIMLVDGKPPRFEVLDAHTVRYTFAGPNPAFLPEIAGAAPLFIFRPAHFLKPLHARYAPEAALNEKARRAGQRNWAQALNRIGNMYRNESAELPSLDPWIVVNEPPTERYVFLRNPYFHRVDSEGRQLPYLDRVIIQLADAKIIPAKVGAGEADLQARYLRFDNFTFLRDAARRNRFEVTLWRTARGAQIALYPNLNASDPVWRGLLRDVRFRRALSLAIDRDEINQSIYFGLAVPGNNTVLEQSPLFKEYYRDKWASHDPRQAGRLLDQIGLTRRNAEGIRLLPDGRPLEVIVETAGEETEQTDVLELVRDAWRKVGVKLFTKPSQRDVFRNRIFAGETVMSIWTGLENGVPTAMMLPRELAPVDQNHLQWPKWGQYVQTKGQAGEPPDLPAGKRLMELYEAWIARPDPAARTAIWHEMLHIHADQVFTIGIVAGVMQPVVVNRRLKNVPKDGVYNWDPGAHFGVYRPDTFWLEGAEPVTLGAQSYPAGLRQ